MRPRYSGGATCLVLLDRVTGQDTPMKLPSAKMFEFLPVVPDNVPGMTWRMQARGVLDENKTLLRVSSIYPTARPIQRRLRVFLIEGSDCHVHGPPLLGREISVVRRNPPKQQPTAEQETRSTKDKPIHTAPRPSLYQLTYRRSMAGAEPTGFQYTRMGDAGPVQCSVIALSRSFSRDRQFPPSIRQARGACWLRGFRRDASRGVFRHPHSIVGQLPTCFQLDDKFAR